MTNETVNEIYEMSKNTEAFKELSIILSHYNFKLLAAYRFDELVFITFEDELSNDFKLIPPTDINDTWKIDILRCTTEMNQAMLTNFVNRLAELNQMLIYLNSFNCKELLDEFSEVWF